MGPQRTRAALAALTGAFALSQFFRSCLAVVAPELQRDLELSPAGFGALSSAFFLAFAVAQLPVGIAFDRHGVGRPTALLLVAGIFGGALFAAAPGGGTALVAQAALGVACAPVYMGLIHYASENLPAAGFARALGTSSAIGMLGALAAAAPLGWAAAAFGWRVPMVVATLGIAGACAAVFLLVHDSGHAEARAESPAAALRGCARLLRSGPLWCLVPLCLAMAAGTSFRNAWGGPYFAEVFRLGTVQRGYAITAVTLVAFSVAFLLPVLVRRWTLKTAVLRWSGLALAAAALLALLPGVALLPDLLLLALLSSLGMLHPLVMSHGRDLVPPALRGRGLGLLNTFVFFGSAVGSAGFGWIADLGAARGWPAATTFGWIFATAAAVVLCGIVPYVFSPLTARRDGTAAAQDGG
ncbi:MAG: MFS transporter [Pseudomonadota bacterium]